MAIIDIISLARHLQHLLHYAQHMTNRFFGVDRSHFSTSIDTLISLGLRMRVYLFFMHIKHARMWASSHFKRFKRATVGVPRLPFNAAVPFHYCTIARVASTLWVECAHANKYTNAYKHARAVTVGATLPNTQQEAPPARTCTVRALDAWYIYANINDTVARANTRLQRHK